MSQKLFIYIRRMDNRTEPNNCTRTKWYGGTRFWYVIIWFGTWFVILVRNFGTILFGSVRGTKFWYETQWFGSCSVHVRTLGSWFPDRNVMFRFGSYFSKYCFFEANRLRTDIFGTKLVRRIEMLNLNIGSKSRFWLWPSHWTSRNNFD